MALYATHARFSEVNVARDALILAKEFIAHPAAMTSGARARHGRGLFKYMPGEQTPAYVLWLADMTFAAGGVTGGAVIAEHFIQSRVVFGNIPVAGVDSRPIPGLSIVQAVRVGSYFFLMALTAEFLRL